MFYSIFPCMATRKCYIRNRDNPTNHEVNHYSYETSPNLQYGTARIISDGGAKGCVHLPTMSAT